MRRHLMFLLLATALASSCAKQAPAPPEPAPVAVTTAFVEARELPDTVQAVGTVEASREAVLSSKIMGTITALRVDEGQRVAKGDVLIVLDAADIKAKQEGAMHAKEEGAAALREAEAGLDEAKAAQENASVNLGRMKSLYDDSAVTKKELDDTDTEARMAGAKVEQAEARIKQAKARIAQAVAAINETEATLGYSVIRSPLNGAVVSKMAQQGEMAVPGMPLLKVSDDTDLRLNTTVKESGLSGINRGDSVRVRVDAIPGLELTGKITEIVPAAEPATRSFVVKVDLPPTIGLLPGMFGRAYLPNGTRKAVLIPKVALVDKEGMKGVYVVTPEGRLTFQTVLAGDPVDDMVEALSGLSGGEKVVVGDTASLKEGMKVK